MLWCSRVLRCYGAPGHLCVCTSSFVSVLAGLACLNACIDSHVQLCVCVFVCSEWSVCCVCLCAYVHIRVVCVCVAANVCVYVRLCACACLQACACALVHVCKRALVCACLQACTCACLWRGCHMTYSDLPLSLQGVCVCACVQVCFVPPTPHFFSWACPTYTLLFLTGMSHLRFVGTI